MPNLNALSMTVLDLLTEPIGTDFTAIEAVAAILPLVTIKQKA